MIICEIFPALIFCAFFTDRHCRGNTPGLCFRGPGCLEKFTDEMGSCWDGSDRIFCTKSVDCEVHGLFR